MKTTANQMTGIKIFCIFVRPSLENRYITILGIKMLHGTKIDGEIYEVIIKWAFVGKRTDKSTDILLEKNLVSIFFAAIDTRQIDPGKYYKEKYCPAYPGTSFL